MNVQNSGCELFAAPEETGRLCFREISRSHIRAREDPWDKAAYCLLWQSDNKSYELCGENAQKSCIICGS